MSSSTQPLVLIANWVDKDYPSVGLTVTVPLVGGVLIGRVYEAAAVFVALDANIEITTSVFVPRISAVDSLKENSFKKLL